MTGTSCLPPPPPKKDYNPARIWKNTGANAFFSVPSLLEATEDMLFFFSYFIFLNKMVCVSPIDHGTEAERELEDKSWVPEAAKSIQVHLKVTSPS